MTLDELVAINFFSPLGVSFHLRYCTTFSDQICNLRFHCSPHFRLLPVKFVYFSALPGLKKQGLGILFVNFRPHFGVKREHTYIHTHRDLCVIYKTSRSAASPTPLRGFAAASQQLQPLRGWLPLRGNIYSFFSFFWSICFSACVIIDMYMYVAINFFLYLM